MERNTLDIYYPTESKHFPTVIWFHGGGLTSGNKYIPKQRKGQGFAVVAINYRLHPHVQSPTYLEDAATGVAWVFKNIARYGGSPTKVFISGHSAGGYITSMIGLDKSYLKKHGIDADNIAGLIPLSGHTITHFTVRKEKGINREQPIVDNMAPLYHIRPDAPPIVLVTGDREKELLGRYEENAYFARMLKVIGHQNVTLTEIKNIGHEIIPNAFPMVVDAVNQILDEMDNVE